MKTISWSKSECKDGWLHRYKIIGQDQNAVVEMCEICRDTQTFKIVNGRVDNMTYLRYHLHSALPRWHRLWERQYTLFQELNGIQK